jgi:CDGSH-type Zn-finger protein
MASAETVAVAVEGCPTGALRYERLDGGPQEQVPEHTTIVPFPNGPLMVRGELEVLDRHGDLFVAAPRVALCRCGESKNQPFCDLSHRDSSFRDHAKAPAPDRDAARNPLDISAIRSDVSEIEQAFVDEIADLHRFFQDWFTGRRDRAVGEFSDRLDPGFTIVDPGGTKHGKDQIVDAVEARAGGYEVAITTDQARLEQTETVLIGTYRERHDFKGNTTLRVATVEMVADESVPTGFRWLSVHETWVEDEG